MSDVPIPSDKPEPLIDEEPGEITIDYIKSNHFRVVHADGASGGITPQLKIQMAMYSERTAIPQRVIHANEEGRLGKEISKEVRADLIREVEVDVVMDLNVAIALRDWLDTRILLLKSAIEEARRRKEPR